MLKVIIKTLVLVLLVNTILDARDIDINKLVQKAKRENKHLFVFLHKTDCGYCDSMIEFTLDDDIVKDILEKRFLFVHINVYEKDNVTYKKFNGSGRQFAKYIGYDFYPTSVFFEDNGEISYVVPGYQDEKKFDAILNYVDSKSYTKMGFRKYRENFDFEKKL